MAWSDARARIAANLATVAITTPAPATIKRVYEFPPLNLEDFPCFVIFPPSVELERGPNLRRMKVYTSRLRLFVKDENLATAVEHLEAWRESMFDMWDSDVALGNVGGVVNIEGPSALEPGAGFYNDQQYTVQDYMLTVRIRESISFSH